MGYRMEKQKSGKIHVIENQAELGEDKLIKVFDSNDDARKLKRFLNIGGAFAGWTPDFFLIDVTKVQKKGA